jgi:hypothetical protein
LQAIREGGVTGSEPVAARRAAAASCTRAAWKAGPGGGAEAAAEEDVRESAAVRADNASCGRNSSGGIHKGM